MFLIFKLLSITGLFGPCLNAGHDFYVFLIHFGPFDLTFDWNVDGIGDSERCWLIHLRSRLRLGGCGLFFSFLFPIAFAHEEKGAVSCSLSLTFGTHCAMFCMMECVSFVENVRAERLCGGSG